MNDKPVPRAEDEPRDNDSFDHAPRRGCSAWWIIVILVVILGVRTFGDRFKDSASQSTAVTIVNAIDQYHTDFDLLPMPTSAVKGQDVETDSSAEEGLIDILKVMDLTGRRRNLDYLGDIKEAKNLEGGKRVDGIVQDAESLALLDPWGRPYRIRLDGDGDGFVDDPSSEGSTPPRRLNKLAIVWSAGKDGDPATWKDNVASWTSGHD